MATVSNLTLSISLTGSDAVLTVEYDVDFTKFERWLSTEGGLNLHSHVTGHGWDGGTTYGPSIPSVDQAFERYAFKKDIEANPDPADLIHVVQVSDPVPRADLIEDTSGTDEIAVDVRIHAPLPPEFTDDLYSPYVVL